MTLEIFHSGVQNRYNEENQLTSHLENKAAQMLFITSIISLLSPIVKIDWYIVVPTILIAIIFYLLMKMREFSVSIQPEQFLTVNNEICVSELEKPLKEAKQKPDEFIRARIESYIKCTNDNKIINIKKAKYLKVIQYLFIIQIGILVSTSLISYFLAL